MGLGRRIVAAIVGVALAALAGAAYVHRERLAGQWMAYRVGRAADFDGAAKMLAWFEGGADREQRLRILVTHWGTGNPRFDYYLARYVASPESSEALRKRFSLELAWREGLLSRWAHFWSWRAGEQVEHRAEEILGYVELLLSTKDPAREITWREVLDLQAIFCLSGQPNWAERLTPDNWRQRYARWQTSRTKAPLALRTVSKPFPDWEGPIP